MHSIFICTEKYIFFFSVGWNVYLDIVQLLFQLHQHGSNSQNASVCLSLSAQKHGTGRSTLYFDNSKASEYFD